MWTSRFASVALAASCALGASSASAEEGALSGAGESCRARSDCAAGLSCIKLTCVDVEHDGQSCETTADCGALRCIDKKCQTTEGARVAASEKHGPSESWMHFDLGGTHPFVGFALMGGPAYAGAVNTGGRFDTAAQGTFLFALRGGIFIDRSELALEVSPFTYFYYRNAPGPTFQVNATYGYLIPLVQRPSFSVYWPLRFGVGLFTGNTGADVYFQARADLIGAAIRVGHFMLDFHAPSFRYAMTSVSGVTGVLMSWEYGVGGSYVF